MANMCILHPCVPSFLRFSNNIQVIITPFSKMWLGQARAQHQATVSFYVGAMNKTCDHFRFRRCLNGELELVTTKNKKNKNPTISYPALAIVRQYYDSYASLLPFLQALGRVVGVACVLQPRHVVPMTCTAWKRGWLYESTANLPIALYMCL